MSTRTLSLKDYIQEEIRMRYTTESITSYKDNEVLHSMFEDSLLDLEKATPIMNPNIVKMHAELLESTPSDPFRYPESLTNELTQELLDVLDIRPTAEDFQKIQEQNIKLAVIGLGGAMSNMLYNMTNFAKICGQICFLDKLVVFEEDVIDFSNLPRFGKPVVFNYHADFVAGSEPDVQNVKTLKKIYTLDEERDLVKDRKPVVFNTWVKEEQAEALEKKGYTMVGAPTLETRKFLQDKNFYFIGHGDYEVDVAYQPQFISTLAVETYGSIDIPALLINLQLATAAFIKQLASGKQPNEGEILFQFDIKKYLEEKGK